MPKAIQHIYKGRGKQIRRINAVERSARTNRGFHEIREQIRRKPSVTFVLYEHGIFSTSFATYRLKLGMPWPENVKYIFTTGSYAKDRLVDAGFPAENIYVIGPWHIMGFAPIARKRHIENKGAFLAIHDTMDVNDIVMKMIREADFPFEVYAKVHPCTKQMPGMWNTMETERLGRARVCISPCPVQTLACLTMASGIPTVLYRDLTYDRFKGEVDCTREYYAELLNWGLPWFEDVDSLRRTVYDSLCLTTRDDEGLFSRVVVGIDVPKSAHKEAINDVLKREGV